MHEQWSADEKVLDGEMVQEYISITNTNKEDGMTGVKRKWHDLIRAWAEGAQIQYFDEDCTGEWIDMEHPNFFEDAKYRIKRLREFPTSSFTDEDIKKILTVNRGMCESVPMARIVADAAVKRYILDTEGRAQP